MDVVKSEGPDEIHPKILRYISLNEGSINAISKLFKKFTENEMIPYIRKATIEISPHTKSSIRLENNYRSVSITLNLFKVFLKNWFESTF